MEYCLCFLVLEKSGAGRESPGDFFLLSFLRYHMKTNGFFLLFVFGLCENIFFTFYTLCLFYFQ